MPAATIAAGAVAKASAAAGGRAGVTKVVARARAPKKDRCAAASRWTRWRKIASRAWRRAAVAGDRAAGGVVAQAADVAVDRAGGVVPTCNAPTAPPQPRVARAVPATVAARVVPAVPAAVVPADLVAVVPAVLAVPVVLVAVVPAVLVVVVPAVPVRVARAVKVRDRRMTASQRKTLPLRRRTRRNPDSFARA